MNRFRRGLIIETNVTSSNRIYNVVLSMGGNTGNSINGCRIAMDINVFYSVHGVHLK